MFDHIPLKAQDHFRMKDCVITSIGMILIITLFLSVLIFIYL